MSLFRHVFKNSGNFFDPAVIEYEGFAYGFSFREIFRRECRADSDGVWFAKGCSCITLQQRHSKHAEESAVGPRNPAFLEIHHIIVTLDEVRASRSEPHG